MVKRYSVLRTSRTVPVVAERILNFCLARKLIWPLWSRRIFSSNGDDLSHSARALQKGWKRAKRPLLAIFPVGWTSPFSLSLSLSLSRCRTIHHEQGTFNLWTVVPGRSILLYSFNPPRPTAPRWYRLDVTFRLWLQKFDSCSDYSNSTLAWLLQLYSCFDV